MRIRALILAATLAAGVGAVVPAQASTVCTLSGVGTSHQVRSIDLPLGNRHLSLEINARLPFLPPGGPKHHHQFVGIWVLNPSLNNASYFFADLVDRVGPHAIELSIDGSELAEAQLPAINPHGVGQGSFLVQPLSGKLLIVGFGNGVGTWEVSASFTGPAAPCPEMAVEAAHVDLDVDDFTGGTQVRGPGVGHARGVSASFTNPYDWMIGGMFAHMTAPFPPMKVVGTSNGPGQSIYEQDIRPFGGPWTTYNFTLDYTGWTAIPSMQGLQFTPPALATWGQP